MGYNNAHTLACVQLIFHSCRFKSSNSLHSADFCNVHYYFDIVLFPFANGAPKNFNCFCMSSSVTRLINLQEVRNRHVGRGCIPGKIFSHTLYSIGLVCRNRLVISNMKTLKFYSIFVRYFSLARKWGHGGQCQY